jgi:hypothetical protein
MKALQVMNQRIFRSISEPLTQSGFVKQFFLKIPFLVSCWTFSIAAYVALQLRVSGFVVIDTIE